MKECPYCYSGVKLEDVVCGNCARKIEHWQTGFYSKQPLPSRTRTMVWGGALLAFLLILGGFARACHWV